MNVVQIVTEYLKEHGYDGLMNVDGECACDLADMQNCEYNTRDCQPGYKVPCTCGEECAYHISKNKPE